MKMLKKMAALLLVGVMALALLTACGEDGTPSFGKQVEDATIKTFNAAIGENSALTNDSALRAQAAQLLENVDADGKIEAQKSIKLPKKLEDMGYGKEITMVVATKDLNKILSGKVGPNDKVDAIKVTAEELAKLQNPQANGVADVKDDQWQYLYGCCYDLQGESACQVNLKTEHIPSPGAPTPGPPGLFSAHGAELTKNLSKYWIDSLKKCQHRRGKL